jgi:esterase/lipase
MIDQEIYCDEYKGDGNFAVLFLHGFPAIRTKNEDLAEHLTGSTSVDCYLPHYPGLGESKGEFSFYKCYQTALMKYKEVREKYGHNFIVLGHSFGGAIALRLFYEFPDNHKYTLLLNPLVMFPTDDLIEVARPEYEKLFFELGLSNYDEVMLEFKKFRDHYSPLNYLKPPLEHIERLEMYLATEDDVTPIEFARMLNKQLDFKVKNTELVDDHWFYADRPGFLKLIEERVRSLL